MKCVTSIVLIFLSAAAGMAQSTTGFATGQSARLVIGQPEFDAEMDSATETILGAASGLAYVNNMLIVADANLVGAAPVNNRVLIYQDLAGQLPAPTTALEYNTLCPVCVGKANLVLGQPDFTTTTPAPCVQPPSTVTPPVTPTTPTCPTDAPQTAIATGLRVPTAVASDGTHLAVADTLNNRVLIWNHIPTNSNQPPDVVVGQKDFTSSSFPGDTPSATSLRGPQGVWIQGGKLFIADTQNDRVLIYNSIPTSNGAAADVVLGQPNFTTWVQVNIAAQNTSAAANNMLTPVSVTSDGTHLFVTDLGYNRVLIWNSIPATNQAPADVEIGQPDMNTGIPDDAYTTTTNSSNETVETPVLCTVSNGIDTNSNPTYPGLCEYTLSFPRYALSDGTRLFVADGGNDRVLIYNTIPTANTAAADAVLGQSSFTADTANSGADTMSAPLSIAFDGSNLFVADTYNQRILVYTVSEQDLPYNAVRNAASLAIYAVDSITIGGTIKGGDKVTITIGVTTSATTIPYTYTIQSGDNLAAIVNGLVALINAGSGDPNVRALADTQANKVVLTARVAGPLGNNVTVATSISTNATITASPDSANLSKGGSAATIAPGSLVSILGTNLSDQNASAPADVQQLPLTLGGVQVYFNGVQSPLLFVSPTQVNAQLPFNFQFSSTKTCNAWVRVLHADGSVTVSNTVAITLVDSNPGIFASPGQEPRKALAWHTSNYAMGVISVDGTIKSGDIGTVCIDSTDPLVATSTIPTGCSGGRMYNYRVQSGDSLASVQKGLAALINQDPQVTATVSSEFTRILLYARTAGSAGNGIPFQVMYNTGADLLLTGIGPAVPSPGSGELLCCANTAGAPVTVDNPVLPGEIFLIYATGMGVPTLSPGVGQNLLSGQPYQGPAYNYPLHFVSAYVDGDTANVLRAELAPGMIGIYEVYLQLGLGQSTNPQAQLAIEQDVNGPDGVPVPYVSNVATLPVFATPLLSSMSCSPSTLNSGGTSTCSVVVSVASPNSSTTITLSSDTAVLTVPSSVTISAGTTSATFTATAGTIPSSETATITATLGNATTTTTITLSP